MPRFKYVPTIMFLAMASAFVLFCIIHVRPAAALTIDEYHDMVAKCKGEMWVENQVEVCTALIEVETRHLALAPENGLSKWLLSYAYYHRAQAHWSYSKIDLMIADFDEAIRISPKHWPSLSERGKFYFQLQHYDRAIFDLENSIKVNSKDAETHWYLASCYELTGQIDKAIAGFLAVLELEPEAGNIARRVQELRAKKQQK